MVYSEAELLKATNNFGETNLLGKGGFGAVYRGSLRRCSVAVKKLTEVSCHSFIMRVIQHINFVCQRGQTMLRATTSSQLKTEVSALTRFCISFLSYKSMS